MLNNNDNINPNYLLEKLTSIGKDIAVIKDEQSVSIHKVENLIKELRTEFKQYLTEFKEDLKDFKMEIKATVQKFEDSNKEFKIEAKI
jgi:hypothetical protein